MGEALCRGARAAASLRSLVCVLVFMPPWCLARDDVYLSVSYYPLTRNVYDGATMVNAVLRYSLKDAEFPDNDCTAVLNGGGAAWSCVTGHAKRLFDACNGRFEGVPKRKSLEYVPPEFAFVKLGSNGAIGLLTRYYGGGSGGARYDWMLHLVRRDGRSIFECPETPMLAGVEVTPGGTVWFQTFCKGTRHDSHERCAERLFYRKQGAFRVSFTSRGVFSKAIPPREKNPAEPTLHK
jgi:hypothetical protein